MSHRYECIKGRVKDGFTAAVFHLPAPKDGPRTARELLDEIRALKERCLVFDLFYYSPPRTLAFVQVADGKAPCQFKPLYGEDHTSRPLDECGAPPIPGLALTVDVHIGKNRGHADPATLLRYGELVIEDNIEHDPALARAIALGIPCSYIRINQQRNTHSGDIKGYLTVGIHGEE